MRATHLPVGQYGQLLKNRTLSPTCADGTPYVLFSDHHQHCPSVETLNGTSAPAKWVVYLSGGAFCFSDANCRKRQRQNPELFGSAEWGPNATVPVYEILSSDPALNPAFYDAAHAWLPYCSQDLWSGSSQANTSNASGLTFRGEDNMLAAWLSLGISNARVMLAGSSAGGIGAMRLANYLARSGHLQENNVTLRLLLDSTWFFDYNNGIQRFLQDAQQPPLKWFNIPVSGPSADPITQQLCFYPQWPNTSALPCCLHSECLTRVLFGPDTSLSVPAGQSVLASLGVQNGLLVASKYDIFSLILSDTQLPEVDDLGEILALLEDYSQELVFSLQKYTAQDGKAGSSTPGTTQLTVFLPPCIGHVWLLPDYAKTSMVFEGLTLQLTAGMWAELRTSKGGPNLQTMIGRWWQRGGNVSNEIVDCNGPNCGRLCPPILELRLESPPWSNAFANVMLMATIAVYLLSCLVTIVCLCKFNTLRRRLLWKNGFAPLTQPARKAFRPTLADIVSIVQRSSHADLVRGHADTVISAAGIAKEEQVRLSFFDLWYRPDARKTASTLKGISLELHPGELTAIIGSSGCGKSTLLDIISQRRDYGVISGQQYINDVPIQRFDPILLRKSIGYVRQNGGGYFPDLTVFDNLMYAALLRLPTAMGADLEARKWLVHDLAREVGLDKALDRVTGSEDSFALTTVATISGGQRRRLAVAVELVSNPKILLLDEPTSGLDAAMSLQMLRLLNELASKGRTILLTIHQPRMEIFRMFDKLVVLHHGRVVMYGKPDAIVDAFIDSSVECELETARQFATGNVADSLLDVMSDDKSKTTALVQERYHTGPVAEELFRRQTELHTLNYRYGTSDTRTALLTLSTSKPCTPSAEHSQCSQTKLVTSSMASFLENSAVNNRPVRMQSYAGSGSQHLHFANQVMICIARTHASMPAVFIPTYSPAVVLIVCFGLLFLNRSEGYILSSLLFSILCTIPYIIMYAVHSVYRKDESVLRKDLDVNAVSPLAYTIGSILLTCTWLIAPVVLIDAALLAIVLISPGTLSMTTTLNLLILFISNGLARLTSSFALLAVCFRFGLGFAPQVALVSWYVGVDGILCGFFISPDDTPWTMRWAYYLAPTYYHFTASVRILLSDVSSLCDLRDSFFDLLSCEASGAEAFLALRGLEDTDVGLHLFISLLMSAGFVFVSWFFIRFELKEMLAMPSRLLHTLSPLTWWRRARHGSSASAASADRLQGLPVFPEGPHVGKFWRDVCVCVCVCVHECVHECVCVCVCACVCA
jgi:ABC-type multidrug transport system ATPase subunit